MEYNRLSCQSQCSYPLTRRPRAGWRSQTSHKDHAVPGNIGFSRETRVSPCMHGASCSRYNSSPAVCCPGFPPRAHGADERPQPSRHSRGAAGGVMSSRQCHGSRTAGTRQRQAPQVCGAHGQVSRSPHAHTHPPAIRKPSSEQTGKQGKGEIQPKVFVL